MSFDFEGDEVTEFTAQLPSATLQAPDAYQRGTLLTLQVQVRVKSVRIEEDRKGELTRKHILALEDVTVTDVLTPAQRQALLDEAARQALLTVEGGKIVEEQEIADLLDTKFDYIPTDADRNAPEAKDDDLVWDGDDGLTTAVAAGSDDEDDDAEHSWMDEDEEGGVHADVAALIG